MKTLTRLQRVNLLSLPIWPSRLFFLFVDAACPPGQYADVSLLTEQCKPCPKGTHSHGGAVGYTNWTVLPPEFDTYSVRNYDQKMPSAKDHGCKYVTHHHSPLLQKQPVWAFRRVVTMLTVCQAAQEHLPQNLSHQLLQPLKRTTIL